MEKHYKILKGIWAYHFDSLEIESYEYDIYGKIINKMKNKKFDFTEDDKNNILKLMKILTFVCDEYEIKILEIIEKSLDV